MDREKIRTYIEIIENATPDIIGAILSFYAAYLSDAHGYPDDVNKIFTGEVWPLLEGHGHSVMEVAFVYGLYSLLEVCDAFKSSVSPKEKAATAVAFAVTLELISPLVGTVIDVQDIVAAILAGIALLAAETSVEKTIGFVEKSLHQNE